MIIHGNYVGTVLPKPDWNQKDPARADYIKGKETVEQALDSKQPKHRTASVQLAAGGWANNVQTVACAGVKADSTVIVVAAPESFEAYSKAGAYCADQAAGSLTFRCKSVPAGALQANILILD